MIDTTSIKKIRKTRDENEVNLLLEEGWKLISIVQTGVGFQYLLVRE